MISRFTSKTEANKIMSIMKTELEEMRGSNKIKMIEGERFIHLGQDILTNLIEKRTRKACPSYIMIAVYDSA